MAIITLDDFFHHISIALILVTAFSWNEAFKHMFDSISFLKNRYFAHAIFITIVVTILLGFINYTQNVTDKDLNEISLLSQNEKSLLSQKKKKNNAENIDMYNAYTYVME